MQKSRPIKKLDGLGMFLARACGTQAIRFIILLFGIGLVLGIHSDDKHPILSVFEKG